MKAWEWILAGIWGVAVACVACGIVRACLDERDRARHIQQVHRATKIRVETAAEREEMDRLRRGAAWVEAYRLQLAEIQALPEFHGDRKMAA